MMPLSPEAKARLGALTREKKDKSLTWPELLDEWNNRLTPQERKAIDAVAAKGDLPVAREDRAKEAVDFAIAHEFELEAVVSEKRLLATALSHGIGDVTGAFPRHTQIIMTGWQFQCTNTTCLPFATIPASRISGSVK